MVQLDRQELGIEVYDDIDIAIHSTMKLTSLSAAGDEREDDEEGEEDVAMICDDVTEEDVTNLLVFSRQLGMLDHARERYE